MLSVLLTLALAVPSAHQTIDGIKPVDDGTVNFAKALVKEYSEDPSAKGRVNAFALGYFTSKVKVMSSLVNTKYTAAVMGVCGTVISIYDEGLAAAIKPAADRIKGGQKDFDTFTPEEIKAIGEASARAVGANAKLLLETESKEDLWAYFSGAQLGTLAAYVTVWHISPKQPTLLKSIAESVVACRERAAKPEAASASDLAAALKAIPNASESTLNEVAIRSIGTSVQSALRASMPAKYRWP